MIVHFCHLLVILNLIGALNLCSTVWASSDDWLQYDRRVFGYKTPNSNLYSYVYTGRPSSRRIVDKVLEPLETLDALKRLDEIYSVYDGEDIDFIQRWAQVKSLIRVSKMDQERCHRVFFSGIRSQLKDTVSDNQTNLIGYLKFHQDEQLKLCVSSLDAALIERNTTDQARGSVRDLWLTFVQDKNLSSIEADRLLEGLSGWMEIRRANLSGRISPGSSLGRSSFEQEWNELVDDICGPLEVGFNPAKDSIYVQFVLPKDWIGSNREDERCFGARNASFREEIMGQTYDFWMRQTNMDSWKTMQDERATLWAKLNSDQLPDRLEPKKSLELLNRLKGIYAGRNETDASRTREIQQLVGASKNITLSECDRNNFLSLNELMKRNSDKRSNILLYLEHFTANRLLFCKRVLKESVQRLTPQERQNIAFLRKSMQLEEGLNVKAHKQIPKANLVEGISKYIDAFAGGLDGYGSSDGLAKFSKAFESSIGPLCGSVLTKLNRIINLYSLYTNEERITERLDKFILDWMANSRVCHEIYLGVGCKPLKQLVYQSCCSHEGSSLADTIDDCKFDKQPNGSGTSR